MEKSKIVLIATGVVSVALAAGIIFLAKGNFARAAEADEAMSSSASRLDGIYRRDIFPTRENVKALDEIIAAYADGFVVFSNSLQKGEIPMRAVREVSPSVFLNQLSAAMRLLREEAPLVDGRKSVAENFNFGFDAYFSGSVMPEEEEVPLMLQQLSGIVLIVRQAYAAQVSQLTKIERAARDKASIGAQGETRRGGREQEEEQPQPRKKGKKPSPEARPPLFSSQPMALEFTARQNAVTEFLNRMNSIARPFVVVKSLSVRKDGDDVKSAPDPEKEQARHAAPQRRHTSRRRPRRGEDRADEPAEEEEVKPAGQQDPSEMPQELRVVSGLEVDPLLKVRVELELFNTGAEGK